MLESDLVTALNRTLALAASQNAGVVNHVFVLIVVKPGS